MALNIGELVGYLGIESGPFDKGLDRATERLKEWGGKGAKIAATGGLAIAAALGGALFKSLDVQDARAELQAQLGLGRADSARIGKAAGQLYASGYGDSLGTVNDAIASVVQNVAGMRNASGRQLKGIAGDVLSLSQTFDTDLGETTKAVGTLLSTGLAKNAKQALDIITAGMQGGANKAGDLLDTFTEYPTQFRKLGISGKQALGLIQQGLKGGARDSDIVADALKEFAIRAVDGSKLTAQGFKMLGLDAGKMAERIGKGGKSASGGLDLVLRKLRGIEDPVKRSQAAVALFGTQAEDLGAALFNLDPSKAVDSLGKVGGAAHKVSTTLQGTASKNIDRFKRTVQTAIVGFVGGKALPVFTHLTDVLAEGLGPAFHAVTGFISDNKDVLVPLIGAVGSAVAVILAIAGAMKVWAGIQAILNAELLANPLVLIIAGLAALAYGLVVAYKKSETFRKIVNGAFHGIKAVAGAVIGWFAGPFVHFFTRAIPGAFNKTKAGIVKAWNAVWRFLKTWGPVALAVLAPFIGIPLLIWQHFDKIKGYASRAFSAAKSAITGVVHATVGVVSRNVARIVGFWTGLPGRVGRGLASLAGIVARAFANAYHRGLSWLDGIVRAVANLPGRVARYAGQMARAGLHLMASLFDGLKGAAASAGSFAASVGRGIVNSVIDGLNAILPHSIPIGFDAGPIHFHKSIPLIPRIPHLAAGGIVPATPGGRLVLAGEGGRDEAVIPLDRLEALFRHYAGGEPGAAVQIDTYNAYDGTTPREVAEELWMLSKARG